MAAHPAGTFWRDMGVMRWWTGRDWAPHTQPPATAQPGPPNEPPKNWFQRNIGWKLAVLLGIAVLGSCSVFGFSEGVRVPTRTRRSTPDVSKRAKPDLEPEPEPGG
jgi:hypothetical protein